MIYYTSNNTAISLISLNYLYSLTKNKKFNKFKNLVNKEYYKKNCLKVIFYKSP